MTTGLYKYKWDYNYLFHCQKLIIWACYLSQYNQKGEKKKKYPVGKKCCPSGKVNPDLEPKTLWICSFRHFWSFYDMSRAPGKFYPLGEKYNLLAISIKENNTDSLTGNFLLVCARFVDFVLSRVPSAESIVLHIGAISTSIL